MIVRQASDACCAGILRSFRFAKNDPTPPASVARSASSRSSSGEPAASAIDDRLDPQREAQVAGDLAGLQDQRWVPGVRTAAQVLHDEVELIGVLVERDDVLGGDPLGQVGPGVDLGQVVLGAGLDELDQLLRAVEQVEPALTTEEDRDLLVLLVLVVIFVVVVLFVFVFVLVLVLVSSSSRSSDVLVVDVVGAGLATSSSSAVSSPRRRRATAAAAASKSSSSTTLGSVALAPGDLGGGPVGAQRVAHSARQRDLDGIDAHVRPELVRPGRSRSTRERSASAGSSAATWTSVMA